MSDLLPLHGIGLDLELLNQTLKDTPESPRSQAPGECRFRVFPGPSSAALGPPPKGYTVEG